MKWKVTLHDMKVVTMGFIEFAQRQIKKFLLVYYKSLWDSNWHETKDLIRQQIGEKLHLFTSEAFFYPKSCSTKKR